MAATDYVSLRRLGTFLSLVKQWVLSFVANRNTQTMSDVTVNTGISGTATIGKSITIHTASGAQTASVMNSNMITNTEPSSNKDKVTKAPTYDLMENTVMTAISDAFDDITTIEYQVVNNASQLPAMGTNGVIYLAAIYSEVENPTGNPHDLGYYTLSNNVYTLTSDTSVQSGTTYYKKEDAYDEYIWLTPENRYEKLGQASIDISGLKFAGSATSGGSALQSEAIPFGSTSSTSSATAFLATVNGITELKDGTCLILKNTKVTSAAATSDPKCFTLDVNGLGAKKVYVTTAAATYATTQFTLNYKYLFVFDSSLDSGNGGWYIGQLFNTNDNTLAYNIRRSYSENKMYVGLYRYQICLTKDDDKIVPVYLPPNPTSTASSQYSTGTAKILTEETFNPWGTIWWYSTTTVVSAGSAPGASYMWDMYSLVDIRYSFNTGSTLVANHDVFMTCEPQDTGFARLHNYIVKTPTTSNPKTEGLFEKSYQSLTVSMGNPKMRGWFKKVNNEYVLAVDTSVVEGTTYYQQKFAVTTDTSVNASKTYYQKVNPITQELPTTDDGLIYVRLGRAYDTYRFSMDYYKPVYYFKDGELRLWTNQTTPKYKSQYFSINPEGELDLVSGSITKGLLSSGVQASLNKADDAIQPTDIKDELDPGGNGEIPDSAAIATYISERNFVEHDSTQSSNGSGTCSYADSLGSTNFYSTGPITYTIAPNQKISFDSQDSTMGYIVKASGSGDGTNQAILASKANGDTEWFNDTGSSVVIRFASATNNENYSYTIVDCGYDDTIEHVYDKIGDAVQSVEITQTASGNDPGTTITIDGGTAHPIVKDNEPGGSSNASVAPSWGAMNTALGNKQNTISDLATIRSGASAGTIAYSKLPLVIEVDDTDETVPSGTYASITTALAAGREVYIKIVGTDVEQEGGVQYYILPLSEKYDVEDDEQAYFFSLSEYSFSITASIHHNDTFSFQPKYFSETSHDHGNIDSDGKLQTNDVNIANGDKLVVTDSSNSSRVARTSLTFDGSTTTQALSKKGTWETFYQKPSTGIPSSDLASGVQTSLGKADTALQSHQDISGKVDYADGTKTTTTKQMGTTAVTIDGISMYTSESTTYTIQNGYTISIDAQGTSTGYIYKNSNSTILAQDPSGDVEWTNTTGESVVVKIGSATSGENYSVTIFKKGYYSTIEELTEKIEEAAASGVQADWDESDADDPAYIKNKPTVYTKPLSGIPKGDLANAVQTSLGKADSAVQSVAITQSSAAGTGGTTIQVDNGNAYQIVSDGEPQGSDNGYVAPTWGAMKTLLDGKVDSVELVKHKTDESDDSYDTCQTDLFVDDISLGTIVATAKPVTSQRPYVAPSWQGFEEKLSEKSDKSNTYTKSEVDGLVSGINNNVIIGELPTTGQLQNRIYRVPGTNSYTDWAWDGSSWVKLAEFSGSIFMQITEAEYDALSDSEKNNGTWYFIEEE